MKLNLPNDVEFILRKTGGYIVGGCMRDILLGKEPSDYDFTGSMRPSEVIALFSNDYKIVETGLEYGTVVIVINNTAYEYTTYRKDVGSKDSRHPEKVFFSDILEEDLERRDFTVNSIAYNHDVGIVDIFNGVKDIENKVIRAVGNPDERFKEDALRMIRAIRIASQHGFTIDKDTYNAIKSNAHLIKYISKERVSKEISKILLGKNPQYIEKLVETGISDFIFPDISKMFREKQNNPNHWRSGNPTTVGQHTMETLEAAVKNGEKNSIYNELGVRLALLLHDVGKSYTRKNKYKEKLGNIDVFYGHPEVSSDISKVLLKNLKFPKKIIDEVSLLIKVHDMDIKIQDCDGKIVPNEYVLRKIYALFGATNKNNMYNANLLLKKFFAIKKCDAIGQNPLAVEGFSLSSAEKVRILDCISEYVFNNMDRLNVIMPVNGYYIAKALGISSNEMKINGNIIGKVLKKLQDKIIRDNSIIEILKDEEKSNKYIQNLALSMGLKIKI